MNYSLLIACMKINLSHVFWIMWLLTNNKIYDPYYKEKNGVFCCPYYTSIKCKIYNTKNFSLEKKN